MGYDLRSWVRKLLSSAVRMTKNVGDIDASIDRLVKGGGYTQQSVDGVIGLMERKRRLGALRYIVADMIGSLSPRRRAVLARRYIYEREYADAAADMGITVRSFHRTHGEAIDECAEFLLDRGLDEKWLDRYFGGEAWITGYSS